MPKRVWIVACISLLYSAATAWAQGSVILEHVVSGLNQPVFLTNAHDGSNRKFIVEQPGRILVTQPESSVPMVFLDIQGLVLSGGERGLLGLAFHPQYAFNGRFFVDYTRQPDGATVIAEYRVSAVDVNAADPVSQIILLVVPQPFANHNGGMIEFGPDGLLYIGMGDGGSGNDPNNVAQNVDALLGKILRIDVDHRSLTAAYTPPAANPLFGAIAGRDEIFATGFRNPWRFSFDRLNGQLYVGDVGQSAREEVDIVTVGGNYGWRVFEGSLCTNLDTDSCAAPAIPPVTEYVNGEHGRCAVTGGYVYRGTRRSLPYGAYVFGDFCSGEIFLFDGREQTTLLDAAASIASFGEDEAGEIYVVDLGGSISRISGASPPYVTQRSFSMPEKGGVFLASNGAGLPLSSVGYAQIQADSGNAVPDAFAILASRQRGIRISETTIAASPPIQAGRISARLSSFRTTGIAIANPNPSAVTIEFNFTDAAGRDFGNRITTIAAHAQIAAFLNENPFNGPGSLDGTFTFRASMTVTAAAISVLLNERSEFLESILPITPIEGTLPDASIFPHWAEGGGWTTEFLLVNSSDVLSEGVINLTGPDGAAVESLPYSIPPRSARRLSPASSGDATRAGWAQIVSTAGSPPSGFATYRLALNGVTITEAGVPAIAPGLAFLGYGEFSTAVHTALAVANPSPEAATVTVELRNLDGTLRNTGSFDLAAFGQEALFLDEMPELRSTAPFQGAVRVSATSPVAATVLRSRVNERGEFLITPIPIRNQSIAASGSELFLPRLAIGGGYGMQFVLINPQDAGEDSGALFFFGENGQPLPLLIP